MIYFIQSLDVYLVQWYLRNKMIINIGLYLWYLTLQSTTILNLTRLHIVVWIWTWFNHSTIVWNCSYHTKEIFCSKLLQMIASENIKNTSQYDDALESKVMQYKKHHEILFNKYFLVNIDYTVQLLELKSNFKCKKKLCIINRKINCKIQF